MRATTKLTLGIGTEPYPGYRLTRFLGRGGLGEVWQGTKSDGSAVALKFLPSDCQLASTQEIRALQNLRHLEHPNLMQLESIWSCPGYLVIVMELADGSLHDLLGVYADELHAPMPPEHLCGYLRQAAEAIDFLNERRHMIHDVPTAIRHCDIKPSNLLVVGPVVKLSDYSLAVITTALMSTCRRAGTLAYAAPEVFQGWLSDRSDQFGLAASYYHLRTGVLPFPDMGTSFAKNHQRRAVDLTPLTMSERAVLLRALAPMPQDRWPSCGEFMDRLSRCFAKSQKAG